MAVHFLDRRHPTVRWIAFGVTILASCDGSNVDEGLVVDHVDIAESRVTVAVGDSVRLHAVAYGRRDRVLQSSKSAVRWASGAPAVARADPTSGWVFGQSAGQATVHATVRNAADQAVVVVVPNVP